MRRVRTWSLVAFVVAAAMIVGASQAWATVVEKGSYSFPFSDSYDDCGFDVNVEGAASGHFRIRAGKGKADTAFFVSDNFSYSETHTNAVTGAFLTITGNAVFNEIKATRVEGNIFSFEAVEAGQPFRVYDSAGNLVLRDRGSIHFFALFDTLGDDVPGGIFLDGTGGGGARTASGVRHRLLRDHHTADRLLTTATRGPRAVACGPREATAPTAARRGFSAMGGEPS